MRRGPAVLYCDAMKIGAPLLVLFLLIPSANCARKPALPALPSTPAKEISRERAIEVARRHVKFRPKSIDAEKVQENGRPLWRVTFRGESVGQGGVMGEVMIVGIDRVTGEVVSIAQSGRGQPVA